MASRGGMVAGTSGADFIHREKVAPHYQQMVTLKARLRVCAWIHACLCVLLCLKLVPRMLDALDIFVLEIEVLEVPAPLVWEYVWPLSALCGAWLAAAARRGRLAALRHSALTLALLGAAPALGAMCYWAPELLDDDGERWQGLRVGSLWSWFVLVCLQLHAAQLHAAWSLASLLTASRKAH